ncbi:hypothetical protein CB1_000160002 [Camelus ferus]|nr:hypothetical protein CB1_000160002 [Camelus ferus]
MLFRPKKKSFPLSRVSSLPTETFTRQFLAEENWFSSVVSGGDDDTASNTFRRSGCLTWVRPPVAGKPRESGPPSAHPGRRLAAGGLPRRTLGTASGGCYRARAKAGLRYFGAFRRSAETRPQRREGEGFLRVEDTCASVKPPITVSSSFLVKVDKPRQDSLPCGLHQSSPERNTEAIMLQQLLITLPTEASTWVKLHHPEKAKEGAPVWEDVMKIFEEALPSQDADETQRECFEDEVTSGSLTAEPQLEKGEEPWLTEREVSGGPSPGSKPYPDNGFFLLYIQIFMDLSSLKTAPFPGISSCFIMAFAFSDDSI